MKATQHSHHSLNDQLRELVILETRLAIATREAHWNVTGPAFYPLHQLFGSQYSTIDGFIDEIAERIRQLGDLVSGSPVLGTTDVSAHADELLIRLSEKHLRITEEMTRGIRMAQENGDEGTADMLTGMVQQHDKMVWMLRSSISHRAEGLINIPA
jgi:starvation-inducible DNA-binding protein